MRNLFLLICFVSFLVDCKHPMKQKTTLVKQGIQGNVQLLTGNAMPMKDAPKAVSNGFETIVYIYPLLNLNDIAKFAENGIYKQLPGKHLFAQKTNNKGEFLMHLPEGRYSLFVGYKNGFFANISNTEGYVQPILIEKQKVANLTITVDADAVY
ncbi:MAG: hypothetical protein ACOVQE_03010 [Chitinophagaceae bacterium]